MTEGSRELIPETRGSILEGTMSSAYKIEPMNNEPIGLMQAITRLPKFTD